MTNILAIPKAAATIQTGTNEDWIEAICYLVGTDTGPQMDLRGINFELEIRRAPPEHEVILRCSSNDPTADGTLSVGAVPNVGYLIFFTPEAVMEQLEAGTYVGDVRASDGEFERVILTINFTLIEGVTR